MKMVVVVRMGSDAGGSCPVLLQVVDGLQIWVWVHLKWGVAPVLGTTLSTARVVRSDLARLAILITIFR